MTFPFAFIMGTVVSAHSGSPPLDSPLWGRDCVRQHLTLALAHGVSKQMMVCIDLDPTDRAPPLEAVPDQRPGELHRKEVSQ